MSHAETIHRLNAAMNTPDTWAQRWQVEREQNERLNAKALRLRGEVLELRRAAVERGTSHQRFAQEARLAEQGRRAEVYDRIVADEAAKIRALDDVIAAMDRLSTEP
jgi:hypothetical protein